MDADRLLAAGSDLAALGLIVESFGPGAVLLREAPAALAGGNLQKLVRDVADTLAEIGTQNSTTIVFPFPTEFSQWLSRLQSAGDRPASPPS